MGAALCLLSAACFGAMAVFGKLAYESGVTPATLVLLRFAAAALLLAVLLAVSPRLRAAPARPLAATSATAAITTRRAVLTALGLGAFGYATQASLYFAALERIDASLVALVLYTYPLLVTVAAAALGRERLTPRRVAALGAASAGTVLVLAGAGGLGIDGAGVGVTLAFAAALVYTGYILVADGVVERLPPVVLTALVMTGAAASLAVRALVTGGVDLGFSAAGWFWLACIVVVSTVFGVLAFFAGLQRTGPSTASILSTFEPVVSAGLAALVLSEHLGAVQVLGAALVLVSAVVVQWRVDPVRNGLEPQTSRAG